MKFGGIQLRDLGPEFRWPSFIAMDEPKHGQQRKTVAPMFTPEALDMLASLIRERSADVLEIYHATRRLTGSTASPLN